ncbi:MAG: hypothetical protein ACI87X_000512 [Candidatus Arcticimaribacter sp.]
MNTHPRKTFDNTHPGSSHALSSSGLPIPIAVIPAVLTAATPALASSKTTHDLAGVFRFLAPNKKTSGLGFECLT